MPRTTDSNLAAEGAGFVTPEPRLRYIVQNAPEPGGVLEIAPGLHWFRMPLPIDLNHINLWLIEDGVGFTLVDTGFPATACTAAWEVLEATLLRARPIQRILLTHYHPDHMGLAAWLQQRCKVPVRIAARAIPFAQFMADGATATQREATMDYFAAHGMSDSRAFFAKITQLNSRGDLSRMPDITAPLVEGEVVTAGPWQFEVIETDGHALAHQSFFCCDPATLISGDQILPSISPNISLSVADWGTDPLGDYLGSLDRLEKLPEDTLVLPSHGRPFRGLRARTADLRAHHQEHLARLRDRLATPQSACALMPALFGRRLFGFHHFLGLHECVAHLEHLVRRQEAVRETTPAGQYLYRLA